MDIQARVREAQGKIIDQLAQCEASIAELYATYGRALPEMGDVWQKLSAEEDSHARLLKSMHAQLDNGNIFYNLGRFDKQATDALIAKVTAESAAAKKAPVSAVRAITVALSIETSILEAHFYEIVTSDAPEFTVIAEHLSKATKRHVELVSELLSRQHDTDNARIRP